MTMTSAFEASFGDSVRAAGACRIFSRASRPKVHWMAIVCLSTGSEVKMVHVAVSARRYQLML